MKALLTDPRDVAAAAPLVATTGSDNKGTVKVSSLQVTTVPLPTPGATVQVKFTDDNGGYDWTLLDAGQNVIGGASGLTWHAGESLPPGATDFNGFSLQIEGVPRSGDVLTVAPTSPTGVATNNGNALSLMALRDANLVDGRNATDGYAQAMADIGVRVQSAKTSSSISTTVAEQAETSRSSQAGVNLDEEGARLIQYQQGYQAAAKVLSVAQAIFDTLLQATAR
jgi:flagellar hook-associated protein 1 FlgK